MCSPKFRLGAIFRFQLVSYRGCMLKMQQQHFKDQFWLNSFGWVLNFLWSLGHLTISDVMSFQYILDVCFHCPKRRNVVGAEHEGNLDESWILFPTFPCSTDSDPCKVVVSPLYNTLQGTNISPLEGTFESMIFLFPRWDMLLSWRVLFSSLLKQLFEDVDLLFTVNTSAD